MKAVQDLDSFRLSHRFAFLFFSLILTMFASPMLAAMDPDSFLLRALIYLNWVAAVLSVGSGRALKVGILLFAITLTAKVSAEFLHVGQLEPASNGMGALVCMLAFFSALRFLLSKGPVNMERISAALSLYLLIGLVFGMLYIVVDELVPSSFALQVPSGPEGESFQLAHSIYFSFVTLGTLGYGDVVPISGPSRALAVTEAMIGQMYIAVVVARLVALYKGENQTEEPRRGGDGVDPTG